MPCQGSQKLSQSSLCLPLYKFSYATVSAESVAPIPWIHISGKSRLFAIFETNPVQLDDGRFEDRQKFKVLQDPEVMEELDLNMLAAEANRSMTQPFNMMNNVHMPEVAVIVKLPNIAMKYQMANGQYRRFQIRFTCDEDYYEAMKMLSRANVPTVAAGSFPAHPKPQHAALANQLTPNDSASQKGNSNYASMAYEQQHDFMGPNPSGQISGLPVSAQMSMAPPAFAASALGNPQSRPAGPLPLHGILWPGPSHKHQPAGTQSHVSLSTATTLVNNRGQLGVHDPHGHQDMDNFLPTTRLQGNGIFANARQESTLDHESSLGLPPRRTLPFPSMSVLDNEVRSPAIPQANICSDQVGSAAAAAAITTSNSKRNESVPPPSPKVTGKRKRAAPKSTTKAARAKKPRAPAKRKKTASKPTDDARPVLTVEELLEQPESTIARRLSRTKSIKSAQNDTNPPPIPLPTPKPNEAEAPDSALPEHDTCREPSLSLGCPSRRRTLRPASPTLSTPQIQTTTGTTRPQTTVATDTQADNNDEHNRECDPYPCTPADQIINACTPGSPSVPHVGPQPVMIPTKMVDTSITTPQGRPTEHLSLGPDVNINMTATSSTITRTHNPTNRLQTEREVEVHRDNTSASDVLFTNPTSAQALAKINDWSQLPPPERRTVLRSHLTHLIMQPSFLSLCQDLSAMWETEFLMGKLANM